MQIWLQGNKKKLELHGNDLADLDGILKWCIDRWE